MKRISRRHFIQAGLIGIIGSKNVDCMTIGMTTTDQVEDAVTRIMRIVRS